MAQYMSEKKRKKLKHVIVYDELYDLIQNDVYKENDKLPSEPDLAAQMNVSRMTLRKALALLQEDGLIKNIHGKGNFITKNQMIAANHLSDTVHSSPFHPMYQYCTDTFDQVEIDLRIEPPTKELIHRLNQNTPAVVIVDRWYKQNTTPMAYSLTFIPIEVISKEQLDLNDKDGILQYLEQEIYQKSYHSQLIFSHSTTGNYSSAQYTISPNESFLLIQETIHNSNHELLLSSKHYIPIDHFRIELDF